MSESVMQIDELGHKIWRNPKGEYHRINGPAIEFEGGAQAWWVNGGFLDWNEEGFWALWGRLTPEQKKDPTLLSYLPGDFSG